MQEERKTELEIQVNGEKLFLNRFVQEMVENMILAMIKPLKKQDKKEEVEEVLIRLKRYHRLEPDD